MKKLLIFISALFFIAATPLYVNAHKTKSYKSFNWHVQAQFDNNWRNEYWPHHHIYRHHNNIRGRHYRRHQIWRNWHRQYYNDCGRRYNYRYHRHF